MFVHENNLKSKIESNYSGLAELLQQLYDHEYIPMRKQLLAMDFSDDNPGAFTVATEIFNSYYDKLRRFSQNTMYHHNQNSNQHI